MTALAGPLVDEPVLFEPVGVDERDLERLGEVAENRFFGQPVGGKHRFFQWLTVGKQRAGDRGRRLVEQALVAHSIDDGFHFRAFRWYNSYT